MQIIFNYTQHSEIKIPSKLLYQSNNECIYKVLHYHIKIRIKFH